MANARSANSLLGLPQGHLQQESQDCFQGSRDGNSPWVSTGETANPAVPRSAKRLANQGNSEGSKTQIDQPRSQHNEYAEDLKARSPGPDGSTSPVSEHKHLAGDHRQRQ